MTHVTAATSTVKYRTEVKTAHHTLIVDEPLDVGGGDLGFKPGELLAAALASCTSVTLRMYADRKGWDLQETMVDVTLDNHPEIPEAVFSTHIRLFGNLTGEQRARLLEIAANCPIHKMLKNPIKVNTTLKD